MKNKIMMAMLAAAMFSASQLSAYNVKPGESHEFKHFEYKRTDGKKFEGGFPYEHNGRGNITCDPKNRVNTVADFNFTYDDKDKTAVLTVSKDAKPKKYEDCMVLGLEGEEIMVPVPLDSDLPSTIIVE